MKLGFSLLILTVALGSATAQNSKGKPEILQGSKVFIAKMEGDLDGFVSAQILKKKLPLTIVTEETAADYIMTGSAVKGVHHWYDTVITGAEKDRSQGNINIVSVKEKTVVWAGEAGDRSIWWGSLKKAERGKLLSES